MTNIYTHFAGLENQSKRSNCVCKDGDKTIVLVAEIDRTVVGFLTYQMNFDDKTREVHLLAVHPDYQDRT